MFYDICIIGSGQSGLTTCKTFSEKNYNVIVLEKCVDCNGMFSTIQEKNYFKWSTSRHMSGFSDFPIDKNIPTWFTIQQYVDYLNLYKKQFGLEKHIQYNSHVVKCRQNTEEEWVVTYINKNNNSRQELICKKLIVCTGLNQTPKFPDITQNFKGELIHTEEVYRRMNKVDWRNKFENKRVLLLGGGESAFDIGHIIATNTDDLYYSTKNYIEWFYTGSELEVNKERAKNINDKCFVHKNLATPNLPTDTQLNYAEYSLPEPMSEFWHNYGRTIILGLTRGFECGKCTHSNKKLCEINETPENLFKKYVVKRTEFLLDIFENKAKVVYYPYKIEGNTVYTKEEVIENVDIIVCASGFKKQFPFLDESVYKGELIKKIIPKNTTNIAFIGFARPTMASIASVAEMQSWWTELYFQNKLNYTIRKPTFRDHDVLNLSNDHIDTLVIGCFYMKDLAKDMNIEPHMFYLLFTDFELFKKIYTGSCHPMIYRIHGIKSYDKGRDVLMDTLPDFEDHNSGSKVYFLMFVVYHILFILFCIFLAYSITISINLLLSFKNATFDKVNFNYTFYFISFFIIFIFYKFY